MSTGRFTNRFCGTEEQELACSDMYESRIVDRRRWFRDYRTTLTVLRWTTSEHEV